MKKLIQAYVSSDLYVAGKKEEGDDYVAERFYVVAEYDNGERIAHEATFNGCEVGYDHEEGCNYFKDTRSEASEKAEELAVRVNIAIKAGGQLDMTKWHEDRPVYGSASHNEHDLVEFEKESERSSAPGMRMR